MIEFKELYITPDNSKLIIDVQVSDLCWYDAVFIKDIYVVPHTKWGITSPKDTDYVYHASNLPEITEDSNICGIFNGNLPTDIEILDEFKRGRKRVRLILNKEDIGDIKDNMFFVYVVPSGIVPKDSNITLPEYEVGVTYNEVFIKDSVMSFVNLYECPKQCKVNNTKFIDFIIMYKALQLSIDTAQYTQAIKIWNSLTGRLPNKFNCKCNG